MKEAMDRLFYNGVIRTMDANVPQAQAVGIKDGKICFVGSNQQAEALATEERIDLQGQLMLPGFNEGHMHLATYAFVNSNIRMDDCGSVEDCLAAVRKRLAKQPDAVWVYGRGWNEQKFREDAAGGKRYPTKEELDGVCREIPVMIVRTCGHAAVCNSAAMERICALPEAKEMADRIHPDQGVVTEGVIKLFFRIIEEPSIEAVEQMLLFGLRKLAKAGITTCQSDDLLAVPGAGWRKVIQAYRNLEARGEMPVRIYQQCLFQAYSEFEAFIEEGYRTGQGGEFYQIGPLKLLEDGSLGAKTAALSKPYPDSTDNRGLLIFSQEEMDRFFLLAQKNDIQVAVHCIGDRAMDVTLLAMKRAADAYPGKALRHGIVHAQLTTPDILRRMAEQKAIAYIQPVFVGTDMDIVEERVGSAWAQDTYAWNTMEKLGILTVGGSDAPVESFDILENIYFAVTRQKLSGQPEGGWLPHEKVSVEQAVNMFTVNAAKACFKEKEIGRICEGMKADLTVLSEDIFSIAPEKIKDVVVCQTITGGKTVYRP